jgi:hypothetical protein
VQICPDEKYEVFGLLASPHISTFTSQEHNVDEQAHDLTGVSESQCRYSQASPGLRCIMSALCLGAADDHARRILKHVLPMSYKTPEPLALARIVVVLKAGRVRLCDSAMFWNSIARRVAVGQIQGSFYCATPGRGPHLCRLRAAMSSFGGVAHDEKI